MSEEKRNEEPEVDESLLTPMQKKLMHQGTFNRKWAVFWGIVLTLMLICLIVILVL